MDPSALFAPGGIVQGLSNLGNSIGDSFKSYALIKQQRDDAEMARTKMLFQAKQDLADRDLRERQFQAANDYQNQQLGMRGREIEMEGQRTQAQIAADQSRQREAEEKLRQDKEMFPTEKATKEAQARLAGAQAGYYEGAPKREEARAQQEAEQRDVEGMKNALASGTKMHADLAEEVKGLQSKLLGTTDPDQVTALKIQLAQKNTAMQELQQRNQAVLGELMKRSHVPFTAPTKPNIWGTDAGNAAAPTVNGTKVDTGYADWLSEQRRINPQNFDAQGNPYKLDAYGKPIVPMSEEKKNWYRMAGRPVPGDEPAASPLTNTFHFGALGR